jgi:hypothetical protein
MDISGKPPSQTTKTVQQESSPATTPEPVKKQSNTSVSQTSDLKSLGLQQDKSYMATVLKTVVDAKIEAKQAAIQTVLLKVGNTQLSVMTDIPLEKGELIKVKVVDNYKLSLSPQPEVKAAKRNI